MKKKNSRSSLLDVSGTPPLVFHYIAAHKNLLGYKPFVHAKTYARFTVFEDDLREKQIPSRDFAYTVVKLLKKKVTENDWKCVPLNMFLGDYAIKLYQKVSSSTVEVDYTNGNKTELLHNELLVARMFVQQNVTSDKFVRLSKVVEDIKPLLSTDWLELYESKKPRPISQALDILMDEYNINVANTYLDIIDSLRAAK
jgi:hypothetical protein